MHWPRDNVAIDGSDLTFVLVPMRASENAAEITLSVFSRGCLTICGFSSG